MDSMRLQDIIPTFRITNQHDRATLADVTAYTQLSTAGFLAVGAVHKKASFVRVLVGVGEMTTIAIVELEVDEG